MSEKVVKLQDARSVPEMTKRLNAKIAEAEGYHLQLLVKQVPNLRTMGKHEEADGLMAWLGHYKDITIASAQSYVQDVYMNRASRDGFDTQMQALNVKEQELRRNNFLLQKYFREETVSVQSGSNVVPLRKKHDAA